MIRALEIPETHQQQIDWLEQELVGTQLSALITEMTGIGGYAGSPSDQALSLTSDPRTLEQGLSWLNPEQLSTLLRNPTVLGSLQQSVLAEDSSYWTRVVPPADDPARAACLRTGEVLQQLLP